MNLKSTISQGFSLVELAIALGILAFAVLAIYGLLPVGLQVSRQARGDLRGVEILSRVAEDFRIWEKMTNASTDTPFYGFPTGFNPVDHNFAAKQSSLVVYQDGSTNNSVGERFTVSAFCEPIVSGVASRVAISVVRGQGAQVSFSSTGATYSKEEGAAFTTLILKAPLP